MDQNRLRCWHRSHNRIMHLRCFAYVSYFWCRLKSSVAGRPSVRLFKRGRDDELKLLWRDYTRRARRYIIIIIYALYTGPHNNFHKHKTTSMSADLPVINWQTFKRTLQHSICSTAEMVLHDDGGQQEGSKKVNTFGFG